MSRQWTKPLEWNNEGAEPSTTLKGTGFVGGYKPPAGVFNYAFNKNQTCIEELQNAIDDVDGDIATLDTSKQAKITGAATTITESNLTANRALVSDSSGKVAVSAVTTTELGYLDGVTSNVQTQLNGKSASNHTHSAATTSANGYMSSTDKAKLNGVEAGATKTTVDSALSSTSTNPVQNKVINEALAEKAASDHTHTAASIGAATTSDLTNAVNAVDIGARNIVTGTANMVVGLINQATRANGQWRYSGTGTIETIDITDAPLASISKGIKVTSTQAQKQIGIVQDKIPLNNSNIYTLSCWVRGSAASGLKCKLQPFYFSTTDNGGACEIDITDQWQFVSYTAVRSPQNTAEYSAAYIYLISAAIGDTMEICGVKFERGNKATDWSPAPEDLATADHTHALATKSSSGFMSAADKSELSRIYGKALTTDNLIENGTEILIGTSVNSETATTKIARVDAISGLRTNTQIELVNTTYRNASTTKDGLLSSEDKTKLDNVTGTIKLVEGESLYPTADTAVTAETGATILNDLRTRTYDASGIKQGNVAVGYYSLAEGSCTTAVGNFSHAEGAYTTATGSLSHAEGYGTTATGKFSHAEGDSTKASGESSHAEGYSTSALGNYSHAGGYLTIANNYQTVIGRYNTSSAGATGESDTSGDIFIIGKGTSDDNRSNALRVTTSGKAYGNGAFGSSGADYAEMFEYADENENGEDRRGLFVTLDGEKIRVANAKDDYILGVVSAAPCIVGDVQSEEWKDRYLRDVFGEKITETVEVEETTDENGVTIPAHTETRYVINPEYDPEKKYTSRDNRKEWAAVGMIGKLIVVDDGTCQVNGYCKPDKDGKATAAETGYRVMSRIDKTHIRILFK